MSNNTANQIQEWLNSIPQLVKEMQSLFSDQKFSESLEVAEKILSFDPEDFNAMSYQATCLTKVGRYDEAITIFNKCLSINNDAFYLWSTRGDCFYELGDYNRAFSDYWMAIQIEPAGAVLDKCARSLFRIGNHKYAIDTISKAIAQAESPEPFLVMEEMLKRIENFDQAKMIRELGSQRFPSDSRFK